MAKIRARSTIVLREPAMESLLTRSIDSFWPDSVLTNAQIVSESRMRQELYATLEAIFEKISDPTTDISIAVEVGAVTAGSAARLYKFLAAFLDSDPLNRRLVLYLPFELIPQKYWRPEHETLRVYAERFAKTYLRCWWELLEETDVRANFADGNILEPELAPYGQDLVRKAAHLLPILVKKGLVEVAEMEALMNRTSSEVLQDSIANALAALAYPPSNSSNTYTDTYDADWLGELPSEVALNLEQLDMRSATDTSRGMPPARVAWERKYKEEQLIDTCASRVASMLALGKIEWKDLMPFMSSPKIVLRLIVLRGIGVAVERLTSVDKSRAAEVARMLIGYLQSNTVDIAGIRDELESTLVRFVSFRFVPESFLRFFGFRTPKLDADFSKTGAVAKGILEWESTVRKIADSPKLSKLLYPAVIFFGSRLKGYAKADADLDVAVFVRPDVPEADRTKVQAVLENLFPQKEIGGRVVEFWLEEHEDGLGVRDFPNPDVSLGDSTWIHLLFGSVWLADAATLKEFYASLLPAFLYPTTREIEGRNIRKIWLAEMEREVLQYRLMHKGYRRFFPKQGGISAAGADGLDPQSTFWDSGYRRLATTLFVKRVFLPQLI